MDKREVPLNMYLSRICPKLKRVFYVWAVGLVDRSNKKDLIGLDIAAKGDIFGFSWLKLSKVSIKK